MADRLQVLFQGMGLVGCVLLAGGFVAREVLCPQGDARLRLGQWLGVVCLLAGALGMAASTVASLCGRASAADVAAFMGGTRVGHFLAWRCLLGLGLAVLAGLRHPAARRSSGMVAVLALAVTFTQVSHAPLIGGVLPLGADLLHVLAMATWTALLLYYAWLGPPEGDVVPRLSQAALICVALLGLTGLYATWAHLIGLSSLWTTDWGRWLLWKLAAVAVALALAGYNRWRLVPRQADPAAIADLRRAVAVEAVMVVLVLLLTAVLTRTEPPHPADEDGFLRNASPAAPSACRVTAPPPRGWAGTAAAPWTPA